MADIVRPRRAAVGLASKGVALARGVGCPRTAEVGGGVGTEVAALGTDRLDDHEVGRGGGVLEGVHLNSLEEVVLGAVEDDGGGSAKVAGEVVEGHDGAVDAAVVAGEEEVHVLVVGDEGLIDRAGVRVGDGAREQGLGGGPAVGVGRVGGGAVGEGCRTPLVGEDPDVLGAEVEQGRGDGGVVHLVLAGAAHVGPVGEEAEVHGAIVAAVVVCAIDEVLAVVGDMGEVLEGDPARLWLCENARVSPPVRGWQAAGSISSRDCESEERQGCQCRWAENAGVDSHLSDLMIRQETGCLAGEPEERPTKVTWLIYLK